MVEHWKYAPPVEIVLARYFQIPEREYLAPKMTVEEARSHFGMMFASMRGPGI